MGKPSYEIKEYQFADIKDNIDAIYVGEHTTLLRTYEDGDVVFYVRSYERNKYTKACLAFYSIENMIAFDRRASNNGESEVE